MLRILDCTLRDGGRVIDCKFQDNSTKVIVDKLTQAGIDIIEVGFLRDWHDVKWEGNSTFFTDTEQIAEYLPANRGHSLYTAFIDYGMFDFDSLKPYDGRSIDGIRFGFTKKNFMKSRGNLYECASRIKELGYKLFVQGVNSLSYKESELLELIEFTNAVKPDGFGIVDTYGEMYNNDVETLFETVHKNLDEDILIDFHSHNNYQMSFSLAQTVLNLAAKNQRELVVDGSLLGMGKIAGNLPTEILAEFLNRKHNRGVDLDLIFDLIEEQIEPLRSIENWGYSLSGLMAGVFSSHPNNVIFLTEKLRLGAKDIKNILSMLSEEQRNTYDYDLIRKRYNEYMKKTLDDYNAVTVLKKAMQNKRIMVLCPGKSLNSYKKLIEEQAADENTIVISVNFFSDIAGSYAFFGNKRRYAELSKHKDNRKVITLANAGSDENTDYVVSVPLLSDNSDMDNSAIMLFHVLDRIGVGEIVIAGFDGFIAGSKNFADVDSGYVHGTMSAENIAKSNETSKTMITAFLNQTRERINVAFLTPSMFDDCLKTEKTNIKLMVLDVDGTLTDGGVYYDTNGVESKRFCIKDGQGIVTAVNNGIDFAIMTARESSIVNRRARELKVKYVFQNVKDKKSKLIDLMTELGLSKDEVGYVGDDLTDIAAISVCGFSACPADACYEVKAVVKYIANYCGGYGAVRDILEFINKKVK